MRLLHLTLPVSDVGTVAAWFHDVLQLRVVGNHVHIGWSTIELQAANGQPLGGVHLAFNVPDNRFNEAMTWLRERVPLQRNPEGIDYFALESNWQSQSVYFTGPDGLILELIGRKRLPASTHGGAFHGSELTCPCRVRTWMRCVRRPVRVSECSRSARPHRISHRWAMTKAC